MSVLHEKEIDILDGLIDAEDTEEYNEDENDMDDEDYFRELDYRSGNELFDSYEEDEEDFNEEDLIDLSED
jgi:hypothetical protein